MEKEKNIGVEENINRKILHKGTETYKNKNIKNEIKKNKTLKEEIDIDLKQELKTTDENDKEKEKQKGKKMKNFYYINIY